MIGHVLSESDRSRIVALTEELIEKLGFRVDSSLVLDRADQAGAQVDHQEKTIRFSPLQLRSLLAQAPERYQVSGCDGSNYLLGGDQPYVSAIVTDPWILDSQTRQPRRPALADVYRNTCLAQVLDHVACVSRMDFPVTDDDSPLSSHRALLVHILNHTKHHMAYVSSDQDLDLWLEIGQVLAQEKPLADSGLLSFAVAIRSPMMLSSLNARILLEATDRGLPVLPTVCPMAGTTAPYDVASTLLQANAECIFLAALTQLLRPGNPFMYMIGPSVSNMRSGADQYYTMEKQLWKLAAVELARAYKLPVGAECGGAMEDAYDLQGAAESQLFMYGAWGSGADLLTGLGSCLNANGLASETIVIQHAFLEAARFIHRGLSLNNLEEGFEDILKAGFDGHFLIDDLTFKQLKEQAFFSNALFDYSGTIDPQTKDRDRMWERAQKQVQELTCDFVSPVPQAIQEGLKALFAEHFGQKILEPVSVETARTDTMA